MSRLGQWIIAIPFISGRDGPRLCLLLIVRMEHEKAMPRWGL